MEIVEHGIDTVEAHVGEISDGDITSGVVANGVICRFAAARLQNPFVGLRSVRNV